MRKKALETRLIIVEEEMKLLREMAQEFLAGLDDIGNDIEGLMRVTAETEKGLQEWKAENERGY